MTTVRTVAAGLAAALVMTGSLAACSSSTDPHASPSHRGSARPAQAAASAPAPTVTGTPEARAPLPAAAPAQGTRPVRLSIPSIGVTTALQPLAREHDGTLQSPSRWQRAGWYADGTRPGQVGPAVIAGHIDSVSGPAIFYRLHELHRGDRAYVTDADGTRLTFVVDGAQQYPKTSFPTRAVYGPTSTPELRLVTCTGDFDYAARSYLDNLVVTSHLVNT